MLSAIAMANSSSSLWLIDEIFSFNVLRLDKTCLILSETLLTNHKLKPRAMEVSQTVVTLLSPDNSMHITLVHQFSFSIMVTVTTVSLSLYDLI